MRDKLDIAGKGLGEGAGTRERKPQLDNVHWKKLEPY